jgi:hypothetical protein
MGKNKSHSPIINGVGSMVDTKFWGSLNDNEFSAIYYLNRLTELAMSMFEWKNLPDSIDYRFLEYILFYDGKALFSKDDGLDEMIVTKCSMSGKMNFYRVPRDRRAYADNGYQRQLTDKDSVVCFNNMLRQPCYPAMVFYAKKLWRIDRTIDINLNAQKTPILVEASEDERLTMKNVYMQYDGNQPVIFGSKNMGLADNLKVFKTDAPYICDKLMDLKNQTWNEALTYLGISNLNIQKKERLVADEAIRQMGGTIASRQSRLEMRRQACDEVNKMFGTDIWVDYREDYRELDETVTLENETEGGGDKKVIRDNQAEN